MKAEEIIPPKEVPLVTLNGCCSPIMSPTLSYAGIAMLTGYYPDHVLSVTWCAKDGSSGTLVYGESVRVTDGLIINAHDSA